MQVACPEFRHVQCIMLISWGVNFLLIFSFFFFFFPLFMLFCLWSFSVNFPIDQYELEEFFAWFLPTVAACYRWDQVYSFKNNNSCKAFFCVRWCPMPCDLERNIPSFWECCFSWPSTNGQNCVGISRHVSRLWTAASVAPRQNVRQ